MPLNFTLGSLDSAKNSLKRIKEKIQKLEKDSKGNTRGYEKKFLDAINQDLNMPKVLAILQEVIKTPDLGGKEKLSLIKEFDKVLVLDLIKIKKALIPQGIKALVDKREKARREKDWKLSDTLRDKIKSEGFTIEDAEKGPKIKKIK